MSFNCPLGEQQLSKYASPVIKMYCFDFFAIICDRTGDMDYMAIESIKIYVLETCMRSPKYSGSYCITPFNAINTIQGCMSLTC